MFLNKALLKGTSTEYSPFLIRRKLFSKTIWHLFHKPYFYLSFVLGEINSIFERYWFVVLYLLEKYSSKHLYVKYGVIKCIIIK